MRCAVCRQPMRKMGKDNYFCPAHPEQPEPKPAPAKKATKKVKRKR